MTRVCSLLPSATETVFALGMQHALVGVSHECDYPPAARCIPRVTYTQLSASMDSAVIDSTVSRALASGELLYDFDVDALTRLSPEIVFSQRLCDVCAISHDRTSEVLGALSPVPRLVNIQPHSLEDILSSIVQIADALACPDRGQALVSALRHRIDTVRRRLDGRPSIRVFFVEWVDPIYCGGHWMSDLITLANGVDALANPHQPSYRIDWQRVLDFAPEVMVVSCCGFDLKRNLEEARSLTRLAGFSALPAARNGRVYAVDGSAYFSRPGPRIVDSLEILAHLLHPEACPAPGFAQAWASVPLQQGAVV